MQQHDIFTVILNTPKKDIAVTEMENIAAERTHANDASTRGKIDATIVRGGMKAKRFFGIGFNH